MAFATQKVGAECGSRGQSGRLGCKSWRKGILTRKKKKHSVRMRGKAYAIAETTMRFSRWCCSLWEALQGGRGWGLPRLLCSSGCGWAAPAGGSWGVAGPSTTAAAARTLLICTTPQQNRGFRLSAAFSFNWEATYHHVPRKQWHVTRKISFQMGFSPPRVLDALVEQVSPQKQLHFGDGWNDFGTGPSLPFTVLWQSSR